MRTAGGNIYRFDPPGALQSEALAINAAGDITGWFSATTLLRQGFVRTADGVTTTFDAPGAGTIDNVGTFPTAINATGVIAGYALADNDEAQGWMRRIDGSFAVFQAPNAGSGGGPYGTYPAGINASGNIVGWDISLSPYYVYHGFTRAPGGAIITFEAPGAGTGIQQGARAASVNDLGQIAGSYLDSDTDSHGFLLIP